MKSLWLLLAVTAVVAQDTDQFTYQDQGSFSPNRIFPPSQWISVNCQDTNTCPGWPERFGARQGWDFVENSCVHCPASGSTSESCQVHHQSPINLQRDRAINGSAFYKDCIDVHWMHYEDGTCTFEELVRLNAFTIERHALRIVQPLEWYDQTQSYRIACRNDGHQFPRIDFSKGFMEWWWLNDISIHVPSEHLQEGHRYAGEMELHHAYSVDGLSSQYGVDNEMATVSIFLEAYDDTPDYDVLNRIICQWRQVEERTRQQCGLDSVTTEYPGCMVYTRGSSTNTSSTDANGYRRDLLDDEPVETPLTIFDLWKHNAKHHNDPDFEPKHLHVSQENRQAPDFDWDEFIASVYHQEEANKGHRHLLNYDHVGPWHNYFGMLGVKTEYYYRYAGSLTIPPCFGPFTFDTRANTNHWRVMKDPLRISQRQVYEMHRLIKDRIAPPNDPIRPCQPDTAAKPDATDPKKISVARPLQSTHRVHYMTFCECQDWDSQWTEDQEWCKLDQLERYYDQPYNYKTSTF